MKARVTNGGYFQRINKKKEKKTEQEYSIFIFALHRFPANPYRLLIHSIL